MGWKRTEGDKMEDYRAGAPVEGQRRIINQIGTYYSVSLASVQVVEHHHPTMCTTLGHGYRLRRRIKTHLVIVEINSSVFTGVKVHCEDKD